MPSFGKKVKEESINDKMVRMFKEGKSVNEISEELEVKADVITNVIRRRCGEDSIPETVVRSKNSMPKFEETALKADEVAANDEASQEEIAEEPGAVEKFIQEKEGQTETTEGLSKLERYMLEKEKKKQEEAEEVVEEAAEPEEVSMEGISTDDLDLGADIYEQEPVVSKQPVEEPEPVAEMEGISAEDIPELSEESEQTAAEAAPVNEEPAAAEEPVVQEEIAKEAASIDASNMNGSALDKMKAFAQMQIAANNKKLAELEAKLNGVEDDYTAQLEAAEKAVEESKVTYEKVLTLSDEIAQKRDEIKAEHRAALAHAEEDYRKKLAQLDEEYNDATAHANKTLAEKEAEINAEADANNAEKEAAKNSFLSNQAVVNDLKNKISSDVDGVKEQIAKLKDENKSYESFMV
ncbi:MAG: hypothetical protein LUE12_05165 [Ruminococcus sp.]|nr:hypothetical protein [Ruminococcus sp.]